MTRGLPDDGEGLTDDGLPTALEALRRGGALALGPGLGRGEGAVAFARALAREAEVAMVLDADGLNAHAGRLGDLAGRPAPTVLTPHAGELGRLLDLDSSQIERERLGHVRVAAERASATVVLKGDDTLIAEPGGRVAVSPGGSPALATAGTGDVLTGVIAALLAQGLDGFEAAAAGVWLHAAAGREAARRQGGADGVIASDVIAALPAVRAGEEGGHRGRGDAERGRAWESTAGGEES
jgi:NAD(P)H-hydrate epimerase